MRAHMRALLILQQTAAANTPFWRAASDDRDPLQHAFLVDVEHDLLASLVGHGHAVHNFVQHIRLANILFPHLVEGDITLLAEE